MPSTVVDCEAHHLPGLAEAAFCSAMVGTDAAQRQMLLSNIVVCGGCAKIPRLHQRFMREVRSLMPSSSRISMLKCASQSLTQYGCIMEKGDIIYAPTSGGIGGMRQLKNGLRLTRKLHGNAAQGPFIY
jgi:hypothetical protein